MGRGKMDEAAAARIRKARGDKVTMPEKKKVPLKNILSRYRMTSHGAQPLQPGPTRRAREKMTSRGGRTAEVTMASKATGAMVRSDVVASCLYGRMGARVGRDVWIRCV